MTYLCRPEMSEKFPNLDIAFFHAWFGVHGQVKVLFSDATFHEFEALHLTILCAPMYPSQELSDRTERLAHFHRERDAVLRAIYEEIGILPIPLTKKARFLKWVKSWLPGPKQKKPLKQGPQ